MTCESLVVSAPKFQGAEPSRMSCMTSLDDLQTDYLDLYLIHWPGAQKFKHDDIRNKRLRKDSWLSLEQLVKEGDDFHVLF